MRENFGKAWRYADRPVFDKKIAICRAGRETGFAGYFGKMAAYAAGRTFPQKIRIWFTEREIGPGRPTPARQLYHTRNYLSSLFSKKIKKIKRQLCRFII